MSDILNYIEENHKETQRLIGVEYEQLQHLLQNAERLDLLQNNFVLLWKV